MVIQSDWVESNSGNMQRESITGMIASMITFVTNYQNENKIWDNNVFTMYLYRQKWKKNSFKSNVPYFHAAQVTWKLTVCPLKFFSDHYLEFFNGTIFWIKGEKIILPWLELRRVGTVFKLIWTPDGKMRKKRVKQAIALFTHGCQAYGHVPKLYDLKHTCCYNIDNYSWLPIIRTFKGNRKKFELSGVRVIEGKII